MEITLKNGRKIGAGHPAYIIAEVGINHNGNFEIAKKLIDKVAILELDAIKFQKRTINELYTQEFLDSDYTNHNSFGKTYGEHKHNLEFSDEQFFELKAHAEKREVELLVSGFDAKSFDFINNELNVPLHKIPSPYINHFPILEKVAKYNKPILISTGMHNMKEVTEAVNFIKKYNEQIVILQCTSTYPIENHQANLRVIQTYHKEFNTLVGYSSHDKGIILSVAAVALGACVIEKHFTFDRTAKGPDHAASAETRGLELIHNYIRAIEEGFGDGQKIVYDEEKKMRIKYGFSIVSRIDIQEGTRIGKDMITYKIPGNGIPPKEEFKILGKIAKNDIKKDEIILTEHVTD